MPVLDPERSPTAGRSALRYRPITTDQAQLAPLVSRARRSRPDARLIAAPVAPDDLDLEEPEEQERVTGRRSIAPAPRRKAPANVSKPSGRTRRRVSPLLFVGTGVIVTMLLWAGISWVVSWGTNEYNNIVYGYPRTFQTDAVVGHNDSPAHKSHFIALNLYGTVSIIEYPAGDASRARMLGSTSVLGPNADQAVVTLRFIDVSRNNHPDMLITVGGVQSVLVNDGVSFRPPTATEQQEVVLYLQQHP